MKNIFFILSVLFVASFATSAHADSCSRLNPNLVLSTELRVVNLPGTTDYSIGTQVDIDGGEIHPMFTGQILSIYYVLGMDKDPLDSDMDYLTEAKSIYESGIIDSSLSLLPETMKCKDTNDRLNNHLPELVHQSSHIINTIENMSQTGQDAWQAFYDYCDETYGTVGYSNQQNKQVTSPLVNIAQEISRTMQYSGDDSLFEKIANNVVEHAPEIITGTTGALLQAAGVGTLPAAVAGVAVAVAVDVAAEELGEFIDVTVNTVSTTLRKLYKDTKPFNGLVLHDFEKEDAIPLPGWAKPAPWYMDVYEFLFEW